MKTINLLSVLLFYCSITGWGQESSMNEARFIRIGEIEQWITIKGADSSNAVILFLHGGPGSPLTPYSAAIFGSWEKEFVLVQWDQRGTGRTFGTYAPLELDPEFLALHPLTVDLIVKDGIALTEYLLKRLGKEKVILLGTSWGSVVGAKMATERPDLFLAYVGHSQVVNPSFDNIYTYNQLLKQVTASGDLESLTFLQSMGPPPYKVARQTGKFIQLIKQYERMNSDLSPANWSKITSEYDNPDDAQNRSDGDDYSFLSYVGDKGFGIEPMTSFINLQKDNTIFELPVYLIQGEEDLLTPEKITRQYFDKISAPQKQLVVVPKAAHGFNAAVVDSIYKILVERILPETKSR